ncbi:MAG TPA: hypothetical protein VD884_14585 [Ohtaekwangia sp.]|nr:hypothetical protein [Ohtaekwangia sp.]
MNKSKKMFMLATLLFLLLLFYVSYDIARRTTFPGGKPQLKTRIQDAYHSQDTTSIQNQETDSLTREKN